jgi:tetratricopeptide (TPR) repeat protein
LHEQYAAFIETLEVDKFLDLIAYHYGRTDNVPKKREYFRKAGEAAARRYANEEAVSYFSRALEVMPSEDLQGRYDLLRQREKVLHHLGQREAQRQNLATMEEIAQKLSEADKRAEVLMRRGIYLKAISEPDEAVAVLEQASTIAEQAANPALVAEVNMEWGQTLTFMGKYPEAENRLTLAQSNAQSRYPAFEGWSLKFLAQIALRQGRFDEGQRYLEQAIPLFQQSGDKRGELFSIEDIGKIDFFKGNFRGARTQFETVLNGFREIGYRWGIVNLLGNLGSVLGAQGEFALSDSMLKEQLSLALQIGRKNEVSQALNNLGFNALDQGNYTEAEAYFEQGRVLAIDTTNRQEEATLTHNLGMVAVLMGDFVAAQTRYDASLAIKRELDDPIGISETVAYQAQLALYLNDPMSALVLAEEAIALAAENEAGLEEARATYFKAQAQLALGRLDEARETYELSVVKHRDVEQAQLALESLGGLAAVALANNTPTDGLPYIEEVLAALTERGTGGLQEAGLLYLRCAEGLAALNDPRASEVRGAGRAFVLSQRAKISDPARRESYVSAVAAHRELVQGK